VLKEDIMKVFHDFHARDKFEKNLNATFNALIPGKKKKKATDIRDFRPISPVGGVYKIVVKVLAANRLKIVLEKIISISNSHNAFIRGRQILDFAFIAILYLWTATFRCLHIINFLDFLDFCLFPVTCFSYTLHVHVGSALSLLINFDYL
jgi:hypothetical protein